jgi:hypothetical protein
MLALLTALPSAPCDLYDAAGTPCVAAHSMVRALYSAYSGPLYLVQRVHDKATTAVPTKSAGGYADSVAHQRSNAGLSHAVHKRRF